MPRKQKATAGAVIFFKNPWQTKEATAILLLCRPCFYPGMCKIFATRGRNEAKGLVGGERKKAAMK
ncbi:MAG: hypothetical protein BGP14_05550 [Sphingobacteriales bacterium 44-15]|nr:MAG: hypothetical protein BGP14_05550 [Sphingobacteriales bacterium 44-15]